MRSEFDTLEQYQESMKEFNENTRMGFEEFIQSHGSDRNKLQLRCTPYTSKKGGYGSFDLDFGLCVYQHQQSKVDELQKRVDEQTRHIEMALLAVKDIHKSAIDEFHDWDVLNEKAPKLCEHLQNLSVAVGELEQALKGGSDE